MAHGHSRLRLQACESFLDALEESIGRRGHLCGRSCKELGSCEGGEALAYLV